MPPKGGLNSEAQQQGQTDTGPRPKRKRVYKPRRRLPYIAPPPRQYSLQGRQQLGLLPRWKKGQFRMRSDASPGMLHLQTILQSKHTQTVFSQQVNSMSMASQLHTIQPLYNQEGIRYLMTNQLQNAQVDLNQQFFAGPTLNQPQDAQMGVDWQMSMTNNFGFSQPGPDQPLSTSTQFNNSQHNFAQNLPASNSVFVFQRPLSGNTQHNLGVGMASDTGGTISNADLETQSHYAPDAPAGIISSFQMSHGTENNHTLVGFTANSAVSMAGYTSEFTSAHSPTGYSSSMTPNSTATSPVGWVEELPDSDQPQHHDEEMLVRMQREPQEVVPDIPSLSSPDNLLAEDSSQENFFSGSISSEDSLPQELVLNALFPESSFPEEASSDNPPLQAQELILDAPFPDNHQLEGALSGHSPLLEVPEALPLEEALSDHSSVPEVPEIAPLDDSCSQDSDFDEAAWLALSNYVYHEVSMT